MICATRFTCVRKDVNRVNCVEAQLFTPKTAQLSVLLVIVEDVNNLYIKLKKR